MGIPPIDNSAGWLAGLLFLSAALWKIWLRLREDRRGDKFAERKNLADAAVLHGYDQVLEQLRSEVARLSIGMQELSTRLEEEVIARRNAESLAFGLQARVAVLERRLRELGYDPV